MQCRWGALREFDPKGRITAPYRTTCNQKHQFGNGDEPAVIGRDGDELDLSSENSGLFTTQEHRVRRPVDEWQKVERIGLTDESQPMPHRLRHKQFVIDTPACGEPKPYGLILGVPLNVEAICVLGPGLAIIFRHLHSMADERAPIACTGRPCPASRAAARLGWL